MPQRFLRPGITNSERWNRVDFACQSFYIRILTLVDDFGQYDARPAVLWGQCFQIWNFNNPTKPIELQQVAVMLQQLAASGLIDVYKSLDGKCFLQVTQWQERIREGCRRKWPENAELQQVAANRSNLLPSPSPSPSPPTPTPTPAVVESFGHVNGSIEAIAYLRDELCLILTRPKNQPLTGEDQHAMVEIVKRPDYADEILLVKKLSLSREKFPQSLTSLVTQWDKIVDRARNYEKHPTTDTKRTDRNKGTCNEGTAHLYRNAGK